MEQTSKLCKVVPSREIRALETVGVSICVANVSVAYIACFMNPIECSTRAAFWTLTSKQSQKIKKQVEYAEDQSQNDYEGQNT